MKNRILILALLLLCAPAMWAQCPNPNTVILSTASGNWNSTSTWVGGVVPADTHVIINNHHVTVNADVKVCDVIIQGTSANLDDDGSAHTWTFDSTGTNPKGTNGTTTKPGPDATALGFFVSQGKLQFTNTTVTTQDDASPWYAVSTFSGVTGCTAIAANAFTCSTSNTTTGTTLSFAGAANTGITLKHLGTSTTPYDFHQNFRGALSPNATMVVTNAHITDSYGMSFEGLSSAGTLTLTNIYGDSPRFALNTGFIKPGSGIPLPSGSTINTIMVANATNIGFVIYCVGASSPTNLSLSELVTYDSGAEVPLVYWGAPSGTSGATGDSISYSYTAVSR